MAAVSARVLLVIGDAAEQFDVLYPLFRLREAGYRVDVAAPEVRAYHLVAHQIPAGWEVTREFEGYLWRSDVAFREVNPHDYLGLVLPGGRAPEYLRYDEHLLVIVRHFIEMGKPIASVCHGIEILAAAGVLAGRRVTTIPKCRFDAEVVGAIYLDEPVVVDGALACAQGKLDVADWMRAFLPLLERAAAG